MEIRCVYTEGNQNVIQEAVDRLPLRREAR